MVTLYHYSPLIHLPSIIREGLSKGEIAQVSSRGRRETAVSLTSQSDADRLYCWGGAESLPSKTAVRYVCHLADGDSNLEPARDAWKRLKFDARERNHLDPKGQSKWWYFYETPRSTRQVLTR